MIPYGRQSIDEDDIAAVVDVLRSNFLTQGPAVEEFETRLCEITGARYAVAMSSGTAALHAAMAVGGIGTGDLVATSPLSFAASANAARYVGADVRFIDIESTTLNLNPAAVPDDVDALVAVHYAGLPVDLTRLSYRPRLVVEDAAHAIGASTPDGPVGNCANSDMCCFSFHPVKTVTTGEGGAVTTNSAALAEGLRRFRHHGVVRSPADPFWRNDIAELGYNYRLTDMQAALGTSQLSKLGRFVDARNDLAERYRSMLGDLLGDRVQLPPAAVDGYRHGYHLFAVRVLDRDRVFDDLRKLGVGVQVHYVPTYRFTSFGGTGDPADFPVTEAEFGKLISLPMYPDLARADQDRVVSILGDVL
jgi:dTDP-4-amino-4,6-dideoxygalactose transaminase